MSTGASSEEIADMPTRSQNIARAWDAMVIMDYLAGTQRARDYKLREIVVEASANDSKILVSRLATAEVAFLGNDRTEDVVEPEIVKFFSSSVIVVADVTDGVAKLARSLVRDFRFDGADAVHVATALLFGVPRIETFDRQMIQAGASMQQDGTHEIEIVNPKLDGQQALPM